MFHNHVNNPAQACSVYFTSLAEYNKAQYALNKAVGGAQGRIGN
jgi:hypothetical protein